MFSSEYYEIFKSSFLYRTPLVAASEFLAKLANHFSVGIFSEISYKSFFSLAATLSEITELELFRSFVFPETCQRCT